MENLTAKESILGLTAKSTKANGSQDSKKGKEYGREFSVILISGNGDNLKQQATACINGRMVINTRENGSTASSMDKALTSLLTEIFSQAPIAMESQRVKVNTNGKMEVYTLVSFKMDSNMVEANGESDLMLKTATCMKDNTRMTRRTAWVNSPGKAATFIKVAIKMTKDTAMERCTGKMDLAIKVSGRAESNMVSEECSFLMVG